MPKSFLSIILVFTSVVFCFGQVKTKNQAPPLTRILLIFDASNSMNALYKEGTRIESAKLLFYHLTDSLQHLQNTELALRIYGDKKKFPPQDCNDTHLEVPFSKGNAAIIKEKVKAIVPKGTTPIARSLVAAIEDFPADQALNMVILITDGIEACDGNPCDAAKELLLNGIVLKPFIIGIGLTEEDKEKFACVGEMFDLNAPETLGSILNIIVKKRLNETTCQINLLNNNNKALVTNVNMTFINKKTNRVLFNFVHGLNNLNVPDTLRIPSAYTYKLIIHTIPEIVKDSIRLAPGRHNTISINVPIGTLNLKSSSSELNLNNNNNTTCLVRNRDGSKIENIQILNTSQSYLEGTYNLEFLTLPRIIKSGIVISSGATTKIEIPVAGTLKIKFSGAGVGSIYTIKDAEMLWVCNTIKDENEPSFRLQPGTYKLIFRAEKAKKSAETASVTFVIRSKENTLINF
jgi:Ca-activated chloride channel family protein